jgi:ADP-ribosyl-[dinitrogen reductase] hydrolase
MSDEREEKVSVPSSLDSHDPVTDRALGMIIGLAIGDALGAIYEFRSMTPKVLYTGLIPRDNFRIDFQYASRAHKGGAVTDDTQMSIALLHSLHRNDGYNRTDVIQSYMNWANGDVPIGRNTRAHFKGVKTIRGYENRVSSMNEESSQSNGSLMRCAPLALLDSWKRDCITDCDLTNRNDINRECSLMLVSLLRARIYSINVDKFSPATKEVRHALESAEHGWMRCLNGKDKGWVCHALYMALYTDLRADTFEDAMNVVYTTSGEYSDCDTLMAITGALIGSSLGLRKMLQEKKTAVNIQTVFEINRDLFKDIGNVVRDLTDYISIGV